MKTKLRQAVTLRGMKAHLIHPDSKLQASGQFLTALCGVGPLWLDSLGGLFVCKNCQARHGGLRA